MGSNAENKHRKNRIFDLNRLPWGATTD